MFSRSRGQVSMTLRVIPWTFGRDRGARHGNRDLCQLLTIDTQATQLPLEEESERVLKPAVI